MLSKLRLLFLIFIFFSCGKNESSGIIPQYAFNDKKFDKIHTFYIFDYITKSELIKNSRKQEHADNRQSFHYYFSHNANIPTHRLKYSENIGQAQEILKNYRHSLKFVYFKDSTENEEIIDCLSEPSNLLCRFE